MEKQELINHLYTIRAGLSYISRQTDVERQISHEINQAETELQRLKTNLIYEKTRPNEIYKKCIQPNEHQIRGIQLEFGLAKTNLLNSLLRKKKKDMRDGVLWALGLFAASLLLLFFLPLSVGLMLGGIGTLVATSKYVKEDKELYRLVEEISLDKPISAELEDKLNKYRSYKEILIIPYQKMKEVEKFLANYQTKITEAEVKIKETEEEIKELEKHLALLNQNSLPILSSCKIKITQMQTALEENYQTQITIADWANIDLLIFYLETGRADDLKEALQLVDRQRQTNQIVSAINQASAAICSSIRTGFSRLAGAIKEGLSIISYQIEKNYRKLDEINSNISTLSSVGNKIAFQQEKLITSTEKLISDTEISNSLLEKANRSSDELLNDLRYHQNTWLKA